MSDKNQPVERMATTEEREMLDNLENKQVTSSQSKELGQSKGAEVIANLQADLKKIQVEDKKKREQEAIDNPDNLPPFMIKHKTEDTPLTPRQKADLDVQAAIDKAYENQAVAKGQDQSSRFADAQVVSDARDGAFLKEENNEEVTTSTPAIDEESLKRQQTLKDVRDGVEPFTAGGDKDTTWSPNLSAEEEIEPVTPPSTPPTDNIETTVKNKKELANERAIQRDLSGKTYKDSLSDIMPDDQKARYRKYFNQERPATGDELYNQAMEKQMEARADALEDTRPITSAGTLGQNVPEVQPTEETSKTETTDQKLQGPQLELIRANKELVESVNNLIKTLEDLKTSNTNDPQMQIIIKNLLIGVGNIVNAEGQSTITTGDSSINKNELNDVGVGEQESTETPATQTPSTEKKTGEEDKEKTTKVEELEKLQKEKEELEKKLNDPNLSAEEKEKIQKSITGIEEVIAKAEKIINIEQQQAAEKVTPLTQEDKKEIDEAGKNKGSFFASITRMFKGGKWKGILANAGLSVASALAVSKIAGAVIATTGPVGIGLVGAGIAVLGTIALRKTWTNLKNVSEAQGMTVREFVSRDKKFAFSFALGSAISATTRGLAVVVPGVGPMLPLLGMATEIAISGIAEAKLNKQQQELVEKYLNTYEARRYTKLKEAGYLAREGVNLQKIVADMTDKNISENERKIAQKTAIAALAYLYNQTKDEKYRYLHYTTTENNQEVRKQIDITDIGVDKVKGDSATNPMLELKGINFESVVDKLDLEELKTLTLEASNHTSLTDRKGLTNEIVGYFVGLETVDAENLLSEEREKYLQSVTFLTGFRTGSAVVNSAILIGSGATLVFNSAQTGIQSSSPEHRQVEQEYRDNLGESDADVDTYVREDGTRVDTIDFDRDGTPDLMHDTSTDEYSTTSVLGAEKLFEIQNPEIGNVTVSEFTSSSTDITGTLVTDTGDVAGVIYNDPSGNIGVLTNAQLEQALGATSGGTTTSLTIANIQPDGVTNLSIGGQTYTTNLTELSNIPGVTGTEGSIGIDPLISKVAAEDSVPSILTKIMQQAKEYNPNLSQYDDYELQRSLYRGDRLGNDSMIRSEFGFTNPVQQNQEYNLRNSPTILGWLEGLNGGPVTLPDIGPGIPGTPGTSEINFAFNGPNVNELSLDGLSPLNVEGTYDITTTHLATLGAAALGAFAPQQVGGIIKTATVEITEKDGESKEPDPTPKPIQPPITPEKEREYISQILRTQIFSYTKEGKLKVSSSTLTIGSSKLVATDSGWILDNKPIGKDAKEIDEIITEFLKLDRDEQAKVLTNMLDRMTVLKGSGRRVTLSDIGTGTSSIIFRKLKDGKWQEVNLLENAQINSNTPESREIITSAQLADKILLIQRDEQQKIVGSIVPPTAKAGEATTTTTQADQSAKKTEEAVKEGTIEASAKVETESAEGKSKEKENVDEFLITVRGIVRSLNNKFKPVTIAGHDYVYHEDTRLWKLHGEAKDTKAQLTDKELYGLFTAAHNSTEKKTKETLSKDFEIMLGRLTGDGTPHGKKNDRIKVGPLSYVRVRGTNELVWKSKDENLTDKELANKIVGLPVVEASAQTNTEQAEKTTEKKEQEKPEKKGRKLLKAALLAVGIGGGIAAGLAGIGGPVALGAAVVSVASSIGKDITKWRESSFQKQYNLIEKDVKNRLAKTYTAEDTQKLEALERKMESARKWRERIGMIGWLTTPLAISSGLTVLLSPQITGAGFEIKT